MTPEELQDLTSRSMTGALNHEEQRRLAEAALEDPALFEELFEQEPVRLLLDDPATRAEALRALDSRTDPQKTGARWGFRPAMWAAGGVMAAVAIMVTVSVRLPDERSAATIALSRLETVVRSEFPSPDAAPKPSTPAKAKSTAAEEAKTRVFVPPSAAVKGRQHIAEPPELAARVEHLAEAPALGLATTPPPPPAPQGASRVPVPQAGEAPRAGLSKDLAQPEAFAYRRAAPREGLSSLTPGTRSQGVVGGYPASADTMALQVRGADGSTRVFENGGTVDRASTVVVQITARQTREYQLVAVTAPATERKMSAATVPTRKATAGETLTFELPAAESGQRIYRVVSAPAQLFEIRYSVR